MRGKKVVRDNFNSQRIFVFWLKIAALIFGIVVALVGVLALIGWQFNITRLQAVDIGFAPMNPLAAIEFILCGLAVCAASFTLSAVARRFSFFLGFLVIVLAALKLLDIFGINIPVDQIFFADKLGNFTPPSRMPPIAAINFILIGLAVLLLDLKYRGRSVTQYLVLTVGSFSLFMVLAYMLGSSFRTLAIFFSPLALHGAINFMLLALAILFLRPDIGLTALFLSRSGGGLIARRLVPLTLILPILLALAGNCLANAGYFDFQLGFALVLAANIVIFEFINIRFSLTVERLDAEREKILQTVSRAKSLDDALLESIGEGIVATDRQGVVILFNWEAEKMFGIKSEQAIGKSIFKLWAIYDKDGKTLAKKDRPVQISLITGKKITSSVSNPYYYAAGDHKIPVAITVTPVVHNGAIAGVIDAFRDISREVEIDQAKSEFVSFASHQLRTPTTAISWQLEMFLEKYAGKLDAEQRAVIEEIYRSNRQVSDLITDFLNVSKIEYGLAPVQSAPVSVVPIIEEILGEQFRAQIEKKKIAIEKLFARGVCAINVDAGLYKLIVDNLISNAIKYTPENGKIAVELKNYQAGETVGNRKLPQSGCVLTVADTGYGIPGDEQDKIFTKFYRTDFAKSKNIPGTGLGLYMVKLFVKKMGGEIWFESEENNGAKFFVLF
ncbi:MAG: ATP-binding protein [Patescibacteria group bacterium]|nr:ATP-binding protein [Patescibacteria group bacterium]